jgi:phage FluMu protein Com
MPIKINLSLQEIYTKLCPKCKKVVEAMAKEKIQDQAVKDMLEGKGGGEDAPG